MKRLHEVPYEVRLTGVVAAGAVISGVAALVLPTEVAIGASTVTNLIWILGGCKGPRFKLLQQTVVLLSEAIWEPEKEN